MTQSPFQTVLKAARIPIFCAHVPQCPQAFLGLRGHREVCLFCSPRAEHDSCPPPVTQGTTSHTNSSQRGSEAAGTVSLLEPLFLDFSPRGAAVSDGQQSGDCSRFPLIGWLIPSLLLSTLFEKCISMLCSKELIVPKEVWPWLLALRGDLRPLECHLSGVYACMGTLETTV